MSIAHDPERLQPIQPELSKDAKEVEATCFSPTERQPFPPGSFQEQIFNELREEGHTLLAENTQMRQKLAQATRIIGLLWQQRSIDRANLTEIAQRYQCSIPDLLNGTEKTVPLTVYQKTQEQLQIIERLESNPEIKSAQEKFIRHVINASRAGQHHDRNGRTRLNLGNIAGRMGMSPSTAQRGIEFCEKQLPHLFDIASYEEPAPNGDKTTRYYAAIKPEALPHLATIKPLEYRKQGGDHTICALCGSKHTHIRKEVRKFVVCDECKHESPLEKEPTITIEYPNASYTAEDAAKRVQNDGIIITIDPPTDCAVDPRPKAAALLLAIAGKHEKHITMPRNHESKYLEVKRSLTLEDLEKHLAGGEAKGAPCSYENDETRSLCWDADELDPWITLEQAAKALAQHGYVPLLEESPADRGGHLWIIFDQLVNATDARAAVYQIVPDLKDNITEYWPAPPEAVRKWNRVRLPGGYYRRSDKGEKVQGWCKLVNVATGESSRDGKAAAALLLGGLTPVAKVSQARDALPCPPPAPASQDRSDWTEQERELSNRAALLLARLTRTSLVPEIPDQDEEAQPPTPPIVDASTVARSQDRSRLVPEIPDEEYFLEIEKRLGHPVPRVDEQWEQNNGSIETTKWYFAIMPDYAVNWFNQNNPLESIQPRERNGMALSPNGAERTASTSYYQNQDGQERYTDHSTHGQRSDGSKDSGDPLELAVKVYRKSKSTLLSETTKEIKDKAVAALESAARAGQPIPSWLEEPVCIITPAGRRKYQEWRRERENERRRGDTYRLGTGSKDLPESTRGSVRAQQPVREGERSTRASVSQPRDGLSGTQGGRDMGTRGRANRDNQSASSPTSQTGRDDKGDEAASPQAPRKAEGERRAAGGELSATQKQASNSLNRSNPAHTGAHQTTGGATAAQADVKHPTASTQGATGALNQPTAQPEPTIRKIGTCLLPLPGDRPGVCGSTHWWPSSEDEYVCAKCQSPIAWTRRIAEKQSF
jgi:hypothetical protein